MRSRFFFGLLVAIAAVPGFVGAAGFADSVVKLRAVTAGENVTFGSAVVVAAQTLATACHVTRDAERVEVSHRNRRWVAESQIGSLANDLCFLHVPGLNLPAVQVRRSTEIQLSEPVTAVGFPGGGDLVFASGVVRGLYAYEQGNVIRTSATFDAGASGGGLFDEAGNLVGLLAFKGRKGKDLHFALPADWIVPGHRIVSTCQPITLTSEPEAFWERDPANQPAFLRLAILEATAQR